MSGGLREIRLFVAAYEERSFTAAASRENATQSGVSQHIRKLEDRFRVRLFTRCTGHVMPTRAGDTYYRQCLEVLRAHDAATQELRRFATGADGAFTVGLMPAMTRSALAPTLARFTEANPNVSVSISEAYSGWLTERVISGEIAFAVVPAFPSGPSLRSRLFARTPEMLVVGCAHHPQLQSGRLRERHPLRLVLPSHANTRRRVIDTYLASNDLRADRILELDAMFGTLDLVAKTDWITILPGIMIADEASRGTFHVAPLADPRLSLDLVLIESARRVLSPAERAFLEILEQETRRVNQAPVADAP